MNYNQSLLESALPVRKVKAATLVRGDNSIVCREVRILDIQRLIRLNQVEFGVVAVGGLAFGELIDAFALRRGADVLETFEVEDGEFWIVFDLFLVGFDDL